MGSNGLIVVEDHMVEPSWHLGEGKLWFQAPAELRMYPVIVKTSGDNLEEQSWLDPLKAVWRQTLASLRQLLYGKGTP